MFKTRKLVLYSTATALILFCIKGFEVDASSEGWYIANPYSEVDWSEHGQYKANMHTHTTQSDGRMSPADKIDAYHELDYAILAITDHDTGGPNRDWSNPLPETTWPWTDYDRDPEVLGMLAVQGNDISRPHHIGSFFNDYGDDTQTSEAAALEEIGSRDGLAVLFHPGRYSRSVEWYVNLYETYDHLVGLEVYNQGDRYSSDRRLWDDILAETMPERPVWGYSNDDAHFDNQIGRNWQMFLLPELTEEALRNAMTNGHFYFAYTPGHGDPAPIINSISVDEDNWTITIEAEDYDEIAWVSGGEVVGDESVISVAGISGVLRAELTSNTGKTYTQPFYIASPPVGALISVY